MALCEQCRKDRAVDTRWDILRSWLFRRLFPKDYTDLAEEKYTRGFGEGYSAGLKSATTHKEDLAKIQAEFFRSNNLFPDETIPPQFISQKTVPDGSATK